MGKQLFPGVRRRELDLATAVKEHPSLWVASLPIPFLADAYAATLHLDELREREAYRAAAGHYLKLTALRGLAARAPTTSSGGAAQRIPEKHFREPRGVVEAHLQRLQRQARIRSALAVRRPHFQLPPVRSVLPVTFRTGGLSPKMPVPQLPRFSSAGVGLGKRSPRATKLTKQRA